MQMGSHRSYGHPERVGDLLVRAFLLMIKDEDGSFDVAEALKLLFDRLLELAFFNLLLRVGVRVGQAVFPSGGLIGERNVGVAVAAPALPLVLSNIDCDSIQIGGDEGFAARARQRAIEPEE